MLQAQFEAKTPRVKLYGYDTKLMIDLISYLGYTSRHPSS
jgi:hypothetical protein